MLLNVVILNNQDLPKLFFYKKMGFFYGNAFFKEKYFFRALS